MREPLPTGAWPPPAVFDLHARYVREVVEDLSLCPFARKCRELGRLHRPTFDAALRPGPEVAARELHALVGRHRDAEVVLLTFVTRGAIPGTPPPPTAGEREFADPEQFEDYVRAVRDAYGELRGPGPRFYMVGFHPAYAPADPRRPLTADSLVPLLRRTPDPVIQCIRADLLDDLRRQAQAAADARFMAEMAKLGPEFKLLAMQAIQSDPELSADIARHNFASVGGGDGRAELERRVADILAARERL
jgi:hypothetical protein